MYDAPIMLLKAQKNTILEVGVGIGYGLDNMLQTGIVSNYTGFEPCVDSYNYVHQRFRAEPNINIVNSEFDGVDNRFDYVFCIEVIEHIDESKRKKALADLFAATGKGLFLSTPDRERDSHGVYTKDELKSELKLVGFSDVVVLREQWTDLYICTR